MILVDSSVWIDYFRGTITPQTDQLDSLLRSQIILVGDLILAEVLKVLQMTVILNRLETSWPHCKQSIWLAMTSPSKQQSTSENCEPMASRFAKPLTR